ncbi:MAG: hydrogenase 4 subunit F [Steroidobacteraceae bacterium]|jgi:hydrogenase-4 component F
MNMSVSVGTAALTGLLGIPSLGALFLVAIPNYRVAAPLNVTLCALTLVSAASLYSHRPEPSLYLLVDDVNTVFLIVGALVGFTTSVFSAGYIAHELQTRRLRLRDLRFYHAMYQLLMFAMNLALVSNNIGLMWVAIELATLTTVVMVGIYRTSAALEAAWKYFILGSVGIALALFGTILVYLAAEERLGQGIKAMAWDHLAASSAGFDPALLNLSFVFLLLGYGTKVGLVPVHAWLPDAHAEGPTPISAVLSGLLLNVALFALLRFKMIMAGNSAVISPGPMMVTMGLVSLVFAGFMIYRRRDIKRMFAYSSIEHMGIITLAFGLGGPVANFAGLLQMTMHSLTKSGIFFGVGYICQLEGTQKIADIRGLTHSQPLLGWLLVVSVIAIAGLPPFGIFTSEFLLVTSTFARAPWLAILLVAGLMIAFSALMVRLHGMAFGATDKHYSLAAYRLAPMALHLTLVAIAGVYLPAAVVAWFRHVASLLG